MTEIYNQPTAGETSNQIFFLQKAVKKLINKVKTLTSEYVRRIELIRTDYHAVRVGDFTNTTGRLGRIRLRTDGAKIYIADLVSQKEVELTLDKNAPPEVEVDVPPIPPDDLPNY
jgi:hypothetical protein